MKAKSGLARTGALKRNARLVQRSPLQAGTNLAAASRKRKARMSATVYESIFTDDMGKCIITGDTHMVDAHHIFGASDKAFSERYHFMLPLRRDWHETADYSIHRDRGLALEFKRKCQDYWINVLHKTKEEWLQECRMWY